MLATIADFEEQFSAQEALYLSDRENTGTRDDDVLARALSSASNEIAGYLVERYGAPLPDGCPDIVRVCCDIARYRLYTQQPTEEVTTRYTAALRWLRDVRAGNADLIRDDGSLVSIPEPSGGASIYAAGAKSPAFGDDFRSRYDG